MLKNILSSIFNSEESFNFRTVKKAILWQSEKSPFNKRGSERNSKLKLTTLISRQFYTFDFEPWELALFLLIMIPTVIWSAVPASNDVLRTPSTTPLVADAGWAAYYGVALIPILGFTACQVRYAAGNFLR